MIKLWRGQRAVFAGVWNEPSHVVWGAIKKLTSNTSWNKTTTVGRRLGLSTWLKPLVFLSTMKLSFALQASHQMRAQGCCQDCGLLPKSFVGFIIWTNLHGLRRHYVVFLPQVDEFWNHAPPFAVMSLWREQQFCHRGLGDFNLPLPGHIRSDTSCPAGRH